MGGAAANAAEVPSGGVAVVAIGASAGGVGALPFVLSALPPDLPAAVVVVIHLDPNARSRLSDVLARDSKLPVREARNGDRLQAGVVYVAPPATHLVVRAGQLFLTGAAPVHYVRPSVDVLFASVAAACGPRAIGVVLTGAGVDGAAGLQAIKAAGGQTIVQDPRTAEYASMPTSARATGAADRVLPLVEIGPAIARLAGTLTVPEDPTSG